MKRQKRFENLFVFAMIFDFLDRKIRLRAVLACVGAKIFDKLAL